ncbi:metal-dependent hydrolase [Bacillaceae bacterium]
MDTVTHTLFGLAIYGAVKKDGMTKPLKRALFFASVVGSQIPDSDVAVSLTETGRIMEQMWHRGITHSLFAVPIWACLLAFLARRFWKVRDRSIFYAALVAVAIHVLSDAMNTWGTGLLEPLSEMRVSLGILPIVDFVIWGIIFAGALLVRVWKKHPSSLIYRAVWLVIGLHVLLQGVQGWAVYQKASEAYDKVALRADFLPWHFYVIGKKDHVVEISQATAWRGLTRKETLYSAEGVDLEPLFRKNPKAEVLLRWSPFVVVVNGKDKLGIYDPRFYRNGSSFLFEYVEK